MKKISVVVVAVLLSALLWYLFLKPYDYSATIKANTYPGTINQFIKVWSGSLENSQFAKHDTGLHILEQQVIFNDSTFLFQWNIEAISDSTSTIKVFIKDIDHSLHNRTTMPFSTTDFEKRGKKTLIDFSQKLNEHINSFKVTVVGVDSIAPTYCAYIPFSGKQLEKAQGMMRNYPILDQMFKQNDLNPKGKPFVEILHWNMQTDSISYNFCYPIEASDSLPKSKTIQYKQFHGIKGIKAIYNGNYITSDRAWYAILTYAENKGIEVDKRPLEVFHTNPNFGGNELHWKAEVFMPFKE